MVLMNLFLGQQFAETQTWKTVLRTRLGERKERVR